MAEERKSAEEVQLLSTSGGQRIARVGEDRIRIEFQIEIVTCKLIDGSLSNRHS